MKTIFHESKQFKKGEVYDISDSNIPKDVIGELFEGEGKYDNDPRFEWCTADKCIKSFTIEIKITNP